MHYIHTCITLHAYIQTSHHFTSHHITSRHVTLNASIYACRHAYNTYITYITSRDITLHHITYTQACTRTYIHYKHIHIRTLHVNIHAYIHTHIQCIHQLSYITSHQVTLHNDSFMHYLYTSIRLLTYINTSKHPSMHTYINDIDTYMHIHIHIHTYTYAHTYVNTLHTCSSYSTNIHIYT